MARPQRCRRICALPRHTRFLPAEGPAREAVILSLDEYEAIRLMDHAGCTHEQCAQVMQVSRTTVTEIYAAARRKIARSLVEGRLLCIDGGQIRLCDHTSPCGLAACPSLPAEAPADPTQKEREQPHA